MPIDRIKLDQFTAFGKLDVECSPGINVFIGANGTGKTHLMKVAYAASDISQTKINFATKLNNVFLPSNHALGRLVKRSKKSTRCAAEIYQDEKKLRISFSNHATVNKSATIIGAKSWMEKPIKSVFIPVKEMLSNAPGFRSLYNSREIHFEEIYADIIDRAYRPALRGPIDKDRKKLLNKLQEIIDGKVLLKNEEFFLKNKQGNLEFTLLSEGMRKLGLLWLLIQNGTLLSGSILFWDEPETNLNPKLFGPLMEILLQLQRAGVQIFISTHDYVILKELDLRKKKEDNIVFHSLYRNDKEEINIESTKDYLRINHNAILQTFSDLYDREIERSLANK